MLLTSGNVNDTQLLEPLLALIRVARPGRGRPRSRPREVLADKGYSSKANRAYLRRRGIIAVIAERDDQKDNRRRRGRLGGRPYAFDAAAYRGRNVVERCFARLKQWRGIATRFEKRAANFRAMVVIAALMIWIGP